MSTSCRDYEWKAIEVQSKCRGAEPLLCVVEMHARGVATKWQSRRKISLGPVRRACPASGGWRNIAIRTFHIFTLFPRCLPSGATWNVQVVRGKMTSRCLWHACRALALGLFLMTVGAGMATIGMGKRQDISELPPNNFWLFHINSNQATMLNTYHRIQSRGIIWPFEWSQIRREYSCIIYLMLARLWWDAEVRLVFSTITVRNWE